MKGLGKLHVLKYYFCVFNSRHIWIIDVLDIGTCEWWMISFGEWHEHYMSAHITPKLVAMP